MKDVAVIVLWIAASGLLLWCAWKINKLVDEFHHELDAAVDHIVGSIPPQVDLTPVLDAVSTMTVTHRFAGTPGSHPVADVEIVKRTPTGYVHHGWRAEGSADIAEALAHPDLAIRRNDVIEGGCE